MFAPLFVLFTPFKKTKGCFPSIYYFFLSLLLLGQLEGIFYLLSLKIYYL